MYVTDSMFEVNRTSSVPKSVLCYELDKDITSIWKLPLTNLVPEIKRLMVHERLFVRSFVRCCICCIRRGALRFATQISPLLNL